MIGASQALWNCSIIVSGMGDEDLVHNAASTWILVSSATDLLLLLLFFFILFFFCTLGSKFPEG